MSKVGICKICGKEFVKVGQEQICSDECRAESKREQDRRHKREYREKKKLKGKQKGDGLNAKIAEANLRGISYGQLMAEKYIDSIRERKIL